MTIRVVISKQLMVWLMVCLQTLHLQIEANKNHTLDFGASKVTLWSNKMEPSVLDKLYKHHSSDVRLPWLQNTQW